MRRASRGLQGNSCSELRRRHGRGMESKPWCGGTGGMKPRAISTSSGQHAFWRALTPLLCGGLLIMGQIATAQGPQQSENAPQAARQIFESTCAGCHGLDGRGGEHGPDISTRQQVVQLSDGELLEILRNGRPAAGMPAFDSLGGPRLMETLTYLRALQG